jgi:hypothetical protein
MAPIFMRTPEPSGRHDINPLNRTEISPLPINYLIITPTSTGDIGAFVWRRTIRVGLVAGNATNGALTHV